jgi:N-acetylneuraminic acid mutarotase
MSTWRDPNGNLWIYGGLGFGTGSSSGYLDDLWEYQAASKQWIWVSGSSAVNTTAVYGTQGTGSATTLPGAREGAAQWIDASGNLWLFGGDGYDATTTAGELNDLWEFNPATGVWTWVSGANATNSAGVYGVQGIPAAGNMPGARTYAASWIDQAGNFWLFGGVGIDSAGNQGQLNDLWKFSPTTGLWVWVGGSSVAGALGTYSAHGVASASNVPGSRFSPATWVDSAGNFWMFGGSGTDSLGANGPLNDLWQFTPATGLWTWVSGSSTASPIGVYGTEGSAAGANVPGGRFGASGWIDANGTFWVFGGAGFDSIGTNGYLGDLWSFNPTSGQWTWVNGAPLANTIGSYGTAGTAATANAPGSRYGAALWLDATQKPWLFGGQGYDASGNLGELNDVWQYTK